MAKDIELKIKLDAADTANTLSGIKKSIKELDSAALNIGAGGKGFDELSKKSAELKDKLDDLKDTTNSLKGSGIEKLNASMSLLKESVVNFDTGKMSTGFKVLGTAMKAIPIFLIIEGIKFLVENFDKLTKSGGIVGKVFGFIKDIIDTVIQAFKDLTDWLGLTNNAIEDNAEKTIEAAKKTGAAVQSRYDDEIKLATAAGKEVFALEIKKQEAVIETARIQVTALKAMYEANGKLTDAQMKNLEELVTTIHNAQIEIQAKTLANTKQTNDEVAKSDAEAADRAIERSKRIADAKKKDIQESGKAWLEEIKLREQNEAIAEQNAINKADAEAKMEAEAIAASGAAWLADIKAREQAELDSSRILEENSIRAKQEEDARREESFSNSESAIKGLQDLSDLVFTIKSSKLKKGSAEELEAAKKQFKVNKALQLGGAIIDAARAVVTSLASAPVAIGPIPNPAGIASLALVALSSAATIAKIAAKQFDAGGGGGGASAPSAPSVPSSASPNTSAAFSGTDLQKVGGTGTGTGTTPPDRKSVV